MRVTVCVCTYVCVRVRACVPMYSGTDNDTLLQNDRD